MRAVVATRCSRVLVTAHDNGSVQGWSMTSEGLTHAWVLERAHAKACTTLAFGSFDTTLITGSADACVHVWDMASTAASPPRQLETLGHGGEVTCVAVDVHTVAAGAMDGTVLVWDAMAIAEHHRDCTKARRRLNHDGKAVWAVALSKVTSSKLVSGAADRLVRVWCLHTGRELVRMQGHTLVVRAVAFMAGDALVVSGSLDKTVRVWNAVSGASMTFPFKGGGDAPVLALAVDDPLWLGGDGAAATLYVAHGKTVSVITAGTNDIQLQGHTASVMSIALLPAHHGVASVSMRDEGALCVWDVPENRLVRRIQTE